MTLLSKQLYAILDVVGASQRMRSLHISKSETLEVLQTITMSSCENKPISVCYFGSTYEGSVTPGMMSDVDVLCCNEEMPIVFESRAGETGNSFLFVRDERTFPGYVKLQRVKNGFPLNINISEGAEHCRADRDGKYCLSNSAGEVKCLKERGPALSYTTSHDDLQLEHMGAFSLKRLPYVYQRDLSRTRRYGWPTEDQLREIDQFGCHLVAKGSEIREETDIEWRISFTLAEKLLMKSLNTTQHKVFLLFKMVTKQMARNVCFGNSISSYQCKTCMLHVVENTAPSHWRPDNLVNCLSLCLSVLVQMLQIGHCPDYFIPQRNLLWSNSQRTSLTLAAKLRRLLTDIPQLLCRLHTDNIGPMLQREGFAKLGHIADTDADVMEFKIKWSVMKVSFAGFLLTAEPYTPEDLTRLLENMLQFEAALGATERSKRKAVAYIKPWVHLHLALSLASRLCRKLPDLSTERASVREICRHLDAARRADLVATTLGMATILLKINRNTACLKLLRSVEERFTTGVLSRCTCHSESYESKFSKQQMVQTSGLSISLIMATSVASCVIFLPSEKDIAPEPLTYEMERSEQETTRPHNHWCKWAVIDAKVYLFFMQYLVNSRLGRHTSKRDAICKIEATIDRDVNLGHKETAYNLLGWIYIQEKRLDKARECFRLSLGIRPDHNAARQFLRDLNT